MAKIKGILFDLDNTLINFMKMKRMACSEAASAMIGAKNAGLITCFAKYGHTVGTISKALANHTIHRIEDVL